MQYRSDIGFRAIKAPLVDDKKKRRNDDVQS
jgi:hypothetical protein